MGRLLRINIAGVLASTWSWVSYAQSTASGWIDAAHGSQNEAAHFVDNDLFSSVRGAAMSRALETSADDMDAALINPAGIGGRHPVASGVPNLKRFFFPWATVTANQNAVDLYKEFGASGGAGSSAIGRATIDAAGGKRQYARAQLTSGIVFGRALIVPIQDHQVAATSRGQDSGLIDAYYRGSSGFGAGGSVESPDGEVSLGYFGYQVARTEIQGTFDYSAFTNFDALKSTVQPYRRHLSGRGHHLGAMWNPRAPWNPAIGMSLRDVGNTRFRDSSRDLSETVPQNLAYGVSVRPHLTRDMSLLVSLGADRLTDYGVKIAKKSHVGLELSFGGLGSYAKFSLRAGVSHGGASFGAGAHLGLIGFQLALQNLDIGAGNEKVIEQRRSLNAYVNVAEF